jgi:hypothetical protein
MIRVREYRVEWADGVSPSYFTAGSAEKAVRAGHFYRGWEAPVATVSILVRNSGPSLAFYCAGGFFAWVPVPARGRWGARP